ncbi:Uncharacterised protein [Mycobacteroides abscessus subsp. abscessus]|nr:Uncharacterised protein [Mycobacteroides abscessus subsp. abscessus]
MGQAVTRGAREGAQEVLRAGVCQRGVVDGYSAGRDGQGSLVRTGRGCRRRADCAVLRDARPEDARRAQGAGHAARCHQGAGAVSAQGRRRSDQPVELPTDTCCFGCGRGPARRQRRGDQARQPDPLLRAGAGRAALRGRSAARAVRGGPGPGKRCGTGHHGDL